jgi:hypothetical protein
MTMGEQEARALAARVKQESDPASGISAQVGRIGEGYFCVNVLDQSGSVITVLWDVPDYEWQVQQARESVAERQGAVQEHAARLGTSRGLVGRLEGGPAPSSVEKQTHGDVTVERSDNDIYVGYGDSTDEAKVDSLIQAYLYNLSLSCRLKFSVVWEYKWSPGPEERLQVQGLRHAPMSVALAREDDMLVDSAIVSAAQKSETLREALRHFYDEVLGQPRPLPGVYATIETMTKALPGGRTELAGQRGREQIVCAGRDGNDTNWEAHTSRQASQQPSLGR